MPETGDAQPRAQKLAAVALQAEYKKGLALHKQGKLADAERIYREVLQQQPNHFDAMHWLGVIALQTRHTERAVELIEKSIRLNASVAAAHNNLGKALLDLKRPEDALASLDQAIALKPGYAMAHHNRGSALQNLNRPGDALASYDKAIALNPDYAEAYNNRGNALLDLKRPEDAIASYATAIALRPDLAEAYSNRGNALSSLKRYAEALMSYERAIALKPYHAETHYNRGIVLGKLMRYDEAFAAYDKAFAADSELTGVEGDRLLVKMRLCDWSKFDFDGTHLIASVRNGKINSAPFPLLMIPSSAAEQLQCAKSWIARKYPPSKTPIWQGERYDHNKIRVAYLSPDFRQHAMSFLTAGMFECHDKSHFEVTGMSFGPNDNSEMRHRLKASFDRFIDVERFSDDQFANLIKELEIDILIDLAGFTEASRTNIFARRSAPIQVNFLGYPGTMGAQYIDYIVSDRIVIPESQHEFYLEKIVYLPDSYYPTSYQINDSKRFIAEKVFTRAELGLPQKGIVFCCFNNNYKVTPRIFDCWMRILNRIEGGVLWLFEDNASAAYNLRKEAEARGVNPRRLVFAKRMSLPDHLARHHIADLFLDTLPCNAHTTASDALWAGLPVLTCLGDTFAGRVAASLLNAIGLPELVTTTLEDYEQIAVDFATHPEKLTIIKRKLADNRFTTPLFDTKLFTKHIEAAYIAMYERHQAGLPPGHIIISN